MRMHDIGNLGRIKVTLVVYKIACLSYVQYVILYLKSDLYDSMVTFLKQNSKKKGCLCYAVIHLHISDVDKLEEMIS